MTQRRDSPLSLDPEHCWTKLPRQGAQPGVIYGVSVWPTIGLEKPPEPYEISFKVCAPGLCFPSSAA